MRPFLAPAWPFPLVVTYAEGLFLGQFLRTALWPQEETMRPPFPLVVTYTESLFEFHLTDAASRKLCFITCRSSIQTLLPAVRWPGKPLPHAPQGCPSGVEMAIH